MEKQALAVHHELLNRGFHVNHKCVQRIMSQLSLKGKRPKEKYHSYKGDVGKVAEQRHRPGFQHKEAFGKMDDRCIAIQFSMGQVLHFSDSGYAHK